MAVALWNLTVAKKSGGMFSPKLNAQCSFNTYSTTNIFFVSNDDITFHLFPVKFAACQFSTCCTSRRQDESAASKQFLVQIQCLHARENRVTSKSIMYSSVFMSIQMALKSAKAWIGKLIKWIVCFSNSFENL